MTPDRSWNLLSPSGAAIDRIAAALDCDRLLATVLVNRGITDPDDARRWLDPSLSDCHDPELLADCSVAIDLIQDVVLDGTITVYADRDVDGIAGATVLLTVLEAIGTTVGYYVPPRWIGYGLHDDAIDTIARRGTDLLVTVDCGTCAHAEIRHAKDRGMDVVVIDHHEPDPELPPADACVNPRRTDCPYPHTELAAGCLAYKVGRQLVIAEEGIDVSTYDRDALPLAAVATVGDRMGITVENRAVVRAGFDRLADCTLEGLATTADRCGVDSVRDLGWSLVPLLNAAQEDPSGDLMLRLLLADGSDRIATLVETLESHRERRRARRADWTDYLESRVTSQTDPEDDAVLVLETDQYTDGVAITRVAERWGKPVVVCRDTGDEYRVAARADADLDLFELFDTCGDLMTETWGHPGAPGGRVPAERIQAFMDCVADTAPTQYDMETLRPAIDIDARLAPDQLTAELVARIDQLRPFGPGNDEPTFIMAELSIGEIERFGTEEQHCKLHPAHDGAFVVLYWDGGTALDTMSTPFVCDVVGTVGWDEFDDVPALVVTDLEVDN